MIQEPQIKLLKEVYFDLLKSMQAKMNTTGKWWKAVEEAYTSENRHFHNFNHVHDMLTEIDGQIAFGLKLNVRQYGALNLMIYFHNIAYDPRNDKHWENSARYWKDFCEDTQMNDISEAGFKIILGLGHNSPEAATSSAHAIINDAYMEIYAASTRRYENFVEGLRYEYSFLNDEEWKEHRLAELRVLWDLPQIYHTQYGSYNEGDATHSIQQEILSFDAKYFATV